MEEAQKVTGITAGKRNEPVWLQWPPQPAREGTDKDCLLTITQPAEMVVKVRRRLLTAPTPQHGARPPQSQRGSPRGLAVYVTQGTHPFGAASCEKPAPSISCHRSSPGAPQSPARTLLFPLLPPNTPLVSPKKNKPNQSPNPRTSQSTPRAAGTNRRKAGTQARIPPPLSP